MISYLKTVFVLLKNPKKISVALRWRLQFFLLSFVAAIFGIIMLFFVVFDVFSPHKTAENLFTAQLKRYEHRLASYFSDLAAEGIHFSRQLSREIEKTLSENNATFDDVVDNQQLISQLEKSTYGLLYDALRAADCSGSFIILDTTVNSNLPDARNSKSGTYLKLANVNSPKPVNPIVLWARGIHELGHDNGHIFHNKWQLEFDISRIPFYHDLLKNASRDLVDSYYYSAAFNFHGTWEKNIILCVPIRGKDGTVFGVCGFEINSIFFKLLHAEPAEQFARVIGLVAQKDKQAIFPGTGLEFGTKEGYYAGLGEGKLHITPYGSLSNYHREGENENLPQDFIGLDRKISLSPLSQKMGDAPWTLACMTPKEDYDYMVMLSYLKVSLFCVAFLTIAVALAYYISRQFNLPILQGIEAFKDGVPQKTYINEIDDLFEFLAKNDTSQEVDTTTFYEFKNSVKKLSRAETAVFNLYMEGHSAAEIADALFVSINTIKSHNKSIYKKLNVSSRKELMVYAQMMKAAD